MKRRFKQLLTFLLAGALVLSFTACDDDVTVTTGNPDDETTEVATTEEEMTIAKPVIYLYSEEDTVCSVRLSLDGELTCTYPEIDSWQSFVAKPDGTLVFPDGKEYYCLYWEGISDNSSDFSKGFCVKGEDTATFLEKTLADIGLTEREANEFIIYWLPILQENEYNVISFQGQNYTDSARLDITPTPDSVLRVYMAYYASETYVDIQPQTFDGFERNGFTVVEWGGGTKIG